MTRNIKAGDLPTSTVTDIKRILKINPQKAVEIGLFITEFAGWLPLANGEKTKGNAI